MEEEQEDFEHDLANLQNDVGKLKELSKLADAQKNAVTVRRIKLTLAQVFFIFMNLCQAIDL